VKDGAPNLSYSHMCFRMSINDGEVSEVWGTLELQSVEVARRLEDNVQGTSRGGGVGWSIRWKTNVLEP
jgi:hypothetical protein